MRDLPSAWLGVALIALHVAAFVALDRATERGAGALRLELPDEPGEPLRVRLSGYHRDRIRAAVDGEPLEDLAPAHLVPGLHHLSWTVAYRSGAERSVGLTRLAGPRLSAGEPLCGVRVRVRQGLLDDGGDGGSLAPLLRRRLADEVVGRKVRHLGELQAIRRLSLQLRPDGGGQLLAHLELAFEHGTVPVSVIAEPVIRDGALHWRTGTLARVEVHEPFRDAAVELFGLQDDIDRAATQRGSLAVGAAVEELAPLIAQPPPLPLPHDEALVVRYCPGGDVRVDEAEAVFPLAVAPIAGEIAPVDLPGAGDPPPLDGDATVAVDVDLDTLNVALHGLWASGYLDGQIAPLLVTRFNASPRVAEYLTLRLVEARFTLPPTVQPAAAGGEALRLGAELELELDDQGLRTRALAYLGLDVALATAADGSLEPTLELAEFTLSCETAPGVREPCYSRLVTLVRESAGEVTGPAAATLAELFDRHVGGGRLDSDELGATVEVRAARLSIHPDGGSAWVRLALDLAISESAPAAP